MKYILLTIAIIIGSAAYAQDRWQVVGGSISPRVGSRFLYKVDADSGLLSKGKPVLASDDTVRSRRFLASPFYVDSLFNSISMPDIEIDSNKWATRYWTGVQLAGKQNVLAYIPENEANKSTNNSLGSSDVLYPTQRAVKEYVDAAISGAGGYTDEAAQDAVGGILSDEFTYDDGAPSISLNNVPWAKVTGAPVFITSVNLALGTATSTSQPVTNSAGSGFTLPVSTTSAAGLQSASDKLKLDDIETGAEVNVNADWNATSGDAQILNKPSAFPPSSHSHDMGDLSGFQIISASNNQLFRYNSSSGKWENWTPSFLDTEVDPIFSEHAAAGITPTNISNWNTAYSWGNHAGAGYITSESDPLAVKLAGSYANPSWLASLPWGKITGAPTTVSGYGITDAQPVLSGTGLVKSSSGTISYVADNSSNWNAAYGWGDHSDVGYITTELDPVFSGHTAAGITDELVEQWNLSYSWGNHADEGYLKSFSETDPVFSEHITYTITPDDIDKWNAAYGWGNPAETYIRKTDTAIYSATRAYVNTGLSPKISGPVSATNSEAVAYDGTTGKVVKGSGVFMSGGSISASGQVVAVAFNATMGILALDDKLVMSGTGTPEGSQVANQGSLFLSSAGVLYKKATGSGNTGWTEVGTGGGGVSAAAGSIIFGTGSSVTEDNSNLFWDNANKRLGIGTNTPALPLDIVGSYARLTRSANTSDAQVIVKPAGALSSSNAQYSFGIAANGSSFNFERYDGSSAKHFISLPTSGDNMSIGGNMVPSAGYNVGSSSSMFASGYFSGVMHSAKHIVNNGTTDNGLGALQVNGSAWINNNIIQATENVNTSGHGKLLVRNQSTGVYQTISSINPVDRELIDNSSLVSLQWNDRQLYNSDGNKIADYYTGFKGRMLAYDVWDTDVMFDNIYNMYAYRNITGNRSIFIDPATLDPYVVFLIKDASGQAGEGGNIILSLLSGSIDGATDFEISQPFGCVSFYTDGIDLFIIK